MAYLPAAGLTRSAVALSLTYRALVGVNEKIACLPAAGTA